MQLTKAMSYETALKLFPTSTNVYLSKPEFFFAGFDSVKYPFNASCIRMFDLA